MDVCDVSTISQYLIPQKILSDERAIDLRAFVPPEESDLDPTAQAIEVHGTRIRVVTGEKPLPEARLLILAEIFFQVNPKMLKKISEEKPLTVFIDSNENLKKQFGLNVLEDAVGSYFLNDNVIFLSSRCRWINNARMSLCLPFDEVNMDPRFFHEASHELGHAIFNRAVDEINLLFNIPNESTILYPFSWGWHLFEDLLTEYPEKPIFFKDYYPNQYVDGQEESDFEVGGFPGGLPNGSELFADAFAFLQRQNFSGIAFDFRKSEKAIEATGDRCLMAGLKTLKIVDAFLKTGDPAVIRREMLRRIPEEF